MKDRDTSHLEWEELDRKTLLHAHVFSVESSRRRAADGSEADYFLLQSPDWCNVIAPVVRSDGVECFVMVRQYRHGSGSVTVEFPGGIVEPSEDLAGAALREFQEETGYTAESVVLIGRVNPNPALMGNLAHTFVTRGARRNGGQDLDGNERVDVELVPVTEIMNDLRPDFHVHSIMVSALLWYERFREDGLSYAERMAGT